ncbi:YcaO-like protein with predicted kinase domain [Ensifer sp. WSM1721]|uniref:YcaO-like family protein n=1 Tax=Ensifer sp. WSM1721 TaxID=1041159 RepID=UPI0012EC10A7|nr:YcaO-like family protein [Ensifer sp. WSM1721]
MASDAPVISYSDRACTPNETLARISSSLSAHGITRLARLTDLDRIGIPVWNAVAPNSRSIVINQGKGILDIDAKVSAAMEALERSVAEDPKVETRRMSIQSLNDEGAFVDPLHSFIRAGQTEIRADEFVDWTLGRDIMAERDVWVPRDALLLDDTKNNRFWQSSDGLASGNTFLEATFHGLLERIERDATTIWQFVSGEEKKAKCVDVHSIKDAVLSDLAWRIKVAGFRLQVFDVTSDIGIPCFEAFIAPQAAHNAEIRYIEVTAGYGAHPNPVRAAIRGVTEAAQSRLTYISGARDDIHPETFSRNLPTHLRDLLLLNPVPYAAQLEMTAGATLKDMLAFVVAKLKAAGVSSAIAVPLNPGERNFSVAKVLVPELENPDGNRKRRFGPRALKRILSSR